MVLFVQRGKIGGASCTSFHLLYLITGTCVCVLFICYVTIATHVFKCVCAFLRCVAVTICICKCVCFYAVQS